MGAQLPGGLLVVRITPADVGRRVTIRSMLDEGSLTDSVGMLRSWSHGVLEVDTRRGLVSLDEAAVVAAKVVAPDLGAYQVQAMAEQCWPPAEEKSLSLELGGWVMRWDEASTGRAASARVCGIPVGGRAGLERAVLATVDWYASHGATPMLQVPDPWQLDGALVESGWEPFRETMLMVHPVSRESGSGTEVELSDEPTADWLDLTYATGARKPMLAVLATRPTLQVFATLQSGDRAGSIGRAVMTGRWAGLTSIRTEPTLREQGLAGRVCDALESWAGAQGADSTFVQVRSDNERGVAFWTRRGYELHHRFRYWRPRGSRVAG